MLDLPDLFKGVLATFWAILQQCQGECQSAAEARNLLVGRSFCDRNPPHFASRGSFNLAATRYPRSALGTHISKTWKLAPVQPIE
jgi:hypothetical protein